MHKFRDTFMRTARLGFGRWREDDLDLALSLWGDLAVTRLIDARGQLTEGEVRERLIREIQTAEEHAVQYWPIFLLDNDRVVPRREGNARTSLVGCCGLRPYAAPDLTYEIGFHVCSAHWRRGYAYEAAQATIDYAFVQLGASLLFAGHNPDNLGSRNLLTKLGFQYTHDEFYPPTGLNHPAYRLSPDRHAPRQNHP